MVLFPLELFDLGNRSVLSFSFMAIQTHNHHPNRPDASVASGKFVLPSIITISTLLGSAVWFATRETSEKLTVNDPDNAPPEVPTLDSHAATRLEAPEKVDLNEALEIQDLTRVEMVNLNHGESWRAVHDLLINRDLLDACVSLNTTELPKLRDLYRRATSAVDRLVAEEIDAKFKAGLAERLTDYQPGIEYHLPKDDDTKLHRSYIMTPTGEAYRVTLDPTDYPELYTLSGYCEQLGTEIDTRENAQR